MILDDKYLFDKCQPFDFGDSPFNAIEFAKELIHSMNELNGLGLAANQVGVPYRIFAIRKNDEVTVCFNPEILHSSDLVEYFNEGCLSYPGLYVKVKRPAVIDVRYADVKGNVQTESLVGLAARAFQHEYDHLEGELFFNKASRYHREKALRSYRRNK